MDYLRMLSDLRQELAQVNDVIAAFERLGHGSGKRRGRPPKWMQREPGEVIPAPVASVKRRHFSAATRAKMAASQRRSWAARRRVNA